VRSRAAALLLSAVAQAACSSGTLETRSEDAGDPSTGIPGDATTADADPFGPPGPNATDALRPPPGPDTDALAPPPDRPDSGTAADTDAAGPPPGPDADAAAPPPPPPPTPCETLVQYGDAWIHPDGHPGDTDVAAGVVTWDGACALDAAGNGVATLSNGWQPIFRGPNCRIALDTRGDCPAPRAACATRVTYGDTWAPAPGHPDHFDDVPGRLFPAGVCFDAGGGQRAQGLSNLWVPHFDGDCRMAFRWTECGGLYTNPVLPFDCPDPGVIRHARGYVLTCTSGNAPDAFPLFTSTDLVHWAPAGALLPAAARPAWAVSDFWAPEIHALGGGYVAYFSARTRGGNLALGAATAPTPTGPFTALDRPLVEDPGMGLIDASFFTDTGDAAGAPYLVWKEDGNAVGRRTPIHVQALAPDGLSVIGPVSTAITNDRGWEGGLVEGPFVVLRDGRYYMFYSANAYYDARYALSVARADSPMGPWEKQGDPLVGSNATWAGPGHGSVVQAPGGDDVLVYHAWQAGHTNEAPGRLVLVDALRWLNGWPYIPGAPSPDSRPRP
jgi:arabinan endo-1,5-alpha-L-arabinosidase